MGSGERLSARGKHSAASAAVRSPNHLCLLAMRSLVKSEAGISCPQLSVLQHAGRARRALHHACCLRRLADYFAASSAWRAAARLAASFSSSLAR